MNNVLSNKITRQELGGIRTKGLIGQPTTTSTIYVLDSSHRCVLSSLYIGVRGCFERLKGCHYSLERYAGARAPSLHFCSLCSSGGGPARRIQRASQSASSLLAALGQWRSDVLPGRRRTADRTRGERAGRKLTANFRSIANFVFGDTFPREQRRRKASEKSKPRDGIESGRLKVERAARFRLDSRGSC